MTRFINAAVLCLAVALPAAPALAQTSDTVPTISVKYDDLSSPASARVLLKRIQAAADSVCGGAPDIRQLHKWTSFNTCHTSAVARAVVTVDSPMLTAIVHRGLPGDLAVR